MSVPIRRAMSSRLTVARRDRRELARVWVDRSRRIKLMALRVHVVYGTYARQLGPIYR